LSFSEHFIVFITLARSELPGKTQLVSARLWLIAGAAVRCAPANCEGGLTSDLRQRSVMPKFVMGWMSASDPDAWTVRSYGEGLEFAPLRRGTTHAAPCISVRKAAGCCPSPRGAWVAAVERTGREENCPLDDGKAIIFGRVGQRSCQRHVNARMSFFEGLWRWKQA